MANQDSGRIGKAVEHLVAATCILKTKGQLNVSTALLDDEGVDLVFFRRDGSATSPCRSKRAQRARQPSATRSGSSATSAPARTAQGPTSSCSSSSSTLRRAS